MTVTLKKNTDTIKLNNGHIIPVVGLGTWQANEKGVAYKAVSDALKAGYRHIDTAKSYGNEEEVGQAIKDSGIPREEIFVTTKLWSKDHQRVQEAIDLSLKSLQLDYVDLYLIHWPVALDPSYEGQLSLKPDGTRAVLHDWSYIDTYRELQKLVGTGKVKAIGVSNLSLKRLKELLDHPDTKVVPATNQIEAHPLLTQPKLFEFAKSKGIVIEAYSPLGSTKSPLFKNETILNIAKKNDVSSAQVLISWAVQRGTVVLPKSVTTSRIEDNLKTFKLPDEDFETLNKLAEKDGAVRTCDPPWGVKIFNDDE